MRLSGRMYSCNKNDDMISIINSEIQKYAERNGRDPYAVVVKEGAIENTELIRAQVISIRELLKRNYWIIDPPDRISIRFGGKRWPVLRLQKKN